MSQRKHFTLIELLVVVGILAILAAILLPVLSKARIRAKTMVCRHHIQQIGRTSFLYADDNDGYLLRNYTPLESDTMPFLAEHCLSYLGGTSYPVLTPADNTKLRDRKLAAIFNDHDVLRCPLQPRPPRSGESGYFAGDHAAYTVVHPRTGKEATIDRVTWSFCINAFNFAGESYSSGSGPVLLRRVPEPDSYVYLTEASQNRPIDIFGKYDLFASEHLGTETATSRMITVEDTRHASSQAGFYFFDGHVESRDISSITVKDFTNHPNP